MAAGASTTITVQINSTANSLMPGSYNDTVAFTNSIDGSGNTTRSVSLSVSPSEKWSGPVSISLKFKDIYEDAAGNEKFKSENVTLTGTLETYIGEEDLVPNEEGCYIYFISDDEQISFCITQKASISTDYVKITTSDIVYLKGLGTISTIGDGEKWTGPFFLDLTKVTFKKNKLGELVLIIVSGKLGGGFDGVAIFSGSLKATLTK